jgi:hypothetical protein
MRAAARHKIGIYNEIIGISRSALLSRYLLLAGWGQLRPARAAFEPPFYCAPRVAGACHQNETRRSSVCNIM